MPIFRYQLQDAGAMGLGPTPNPGANRSVSEDRPCDPLGGRYSRERLAGRWISTLAFPTRILPDGPPNLGARLRGTPGVLGVTLLLRVLLVTWYRFLPIFQIRSTGVFSPWLLFTMTTVFFFRDRSLRRTRYKWRICTRSACYKLATSRP